jgi:hypothetical protein
VPSVVLIFSIRKSLYLKYPSNRILKEIPRNKNVFFEARLFLLVNNDPIT